MPLPRICFNSPKNSAVLGFWSFFLTLLCIKAALINNKLAIESEPVLLNFHFLSHSLALVFKSNLIRIVVPLTACVICEADPGLWRCLTRAAKSFPGISGNFGYTKCWVCSWWGHFLLTSTNQYSGEGSDPEALSSRAHTTKRWPINVYFQINVAGTAWIKPRDDWFWRTQSTVPSNIRHFYTEVFHWLRFSLTPFTFCLRIIIIFFLEPRT